MLNTPVLDTVELAAARATPPEPRAVAPSAKRRVATPGQLFVSSTPWGELYVDGRLLGNTPQKALPLSPGSHVVRIVRNGFQPFERRILVVPGRVMRLTDIVLERLGR